MIETLGNYLSYDFVRNALLAGSLAAILGAVVGYFVAVRKVNFAAHALAHIGFTGAAGAALLGLSPLEGMLVISVLAGVAMGASGDRPLKSDLAIGMTLSLFLGLGILFLTFYKGFAGQATAILFGNLFGVSAGQIRQTVAVAAVSLAALAVFSRKLLFASVQPDLAEARGISLPAQSILFMVILAASVSLASQVIGTLLAFSLVVGPAGMAVRLCGGFWTGVAVSVALGLLCVWSGILAACATNGPPSFWIAAILFGLYLVVEIAGRLRGR